MRSFLAQLQTCLPANAALYCKHKQTSITQMSALILKTSRCHHMVLQGNSELTELFDLESAEELLERFACALVQTYTCAHNDFTPEQQVSSCLCCLLHVIFPQNYSGHKMTASFLADLATVCPADKFTCCQTIIMPSL